MFHRIHPSVALRACFLWSDGMGTKPDSWKGHLAAWRSSGLTQAAYCGQRGLSLPCFGYWRRKLHNAAASSVCALVPIVMGEISEPDEAIEVHLPNGLQARLPIGMEPSRWMLFIRALRTC
jgi:hypothetical protein